MKKRRTFASFMRRVSSSFSFFITARGIAAYSLNNRRQLFLSRGKINVAFELEDSPPENVQYVCCSFAIARLNNKLISSMKFSSLGAIFLAEQVKYPKISQTHKSTIRI